MAKTYTVEIDLDDKDAIKALNDIDKGVEQIGKTTKKTQETTKGLKKGFEGVGLAIKAMGIGIVLKAFDAFFDVLKNNQTVLDALSVAAETISIFFNDITQSLIDTYKRVKDATGGFDAMGRIITNLINIAIAPLKLQFYAIKLAVQEAQLIWEKSFFGDGDPEAIKQLNEGIQETKDNIVGTAKSVWQSGLEIAKDFGEAIDEVKTLGTVAVEELSDVSFTAAHEQAKVNVELQKAAEIGEAKNRVLLEQYDQLAEGLRQVRDDETMSIQDRITANETLANILDMQKEKMLENVQATVDAAQAQYNKNQSDENYIALLNARAEKEGILAQITGFQSEQLTNQNALLKEQEEIVNSLSESETSLAAEREKFNAELIDDEQLRLERKLEILDLEKQKELERLDDIRQRASEGTQAKIDAEIAYNEKKEEFRQQEITLEKELAEKKKQIQQENLQTGLNIAASAFAMMAELSADDFETQKKFQIAGAVVSTIQGAINAYMSAQSLPQPYGAIAGALLAALATATGVAQIAKIKATTPESAGGAASAPVTSAPSFSMVNPMTEGETQMNQNLNAEIDPPKSYVVSGDVSSQQALDRRVNNQAVIN